MPTGNPWRDTGLTNAQRFWAYVDVSGDCWLWEGSKHSAGYGRFIIEHKQYLAHRWAYTYHYGVELDEHLVLDHLCENKTCVNHDHLEEVTQSENSRRYHVGGLTYAETKKIYRLWVRNTWFTGIGAIAGWAALIVVLILWLM